MSDSIPKIAVELDENCQRMAKILGISKDQILDGVNERNVGVATDDFSRFIAFRELPNESIIMTECLVTDKNERDLDSEDGAAVEVTIKKVQVKIALMLKRELPAGSLSRKKEDGELNLAIVAQSFGFPISCHCEEPPSTLYSGPWDGKEFRIGHDGDRNFMCFAFIDKTKMECDLVWALDIDKYLGWHKKTCETKSS